jgi:hypothetical protein
LSPPPGGFPKEVRLAVFNRLDRRKLYTGEHGDDMPEVKDWRRA